MITSDKIDSTKPDKTYLGMAFNDRIAEARRRINEYIHKFADKYPNAGTIINPDILLFELTRAGILQYFPKSAVFNRDTSRTRRDERIPDDIFKMMVEHNNGPYQTSFRVQNGLDPEWVGYKFKEERK